jgi:hypothetical protein
MRHCRYTSFTHSQRSVLTSNVVVGTVAFEGYSQSFSFPTHETRDRIKLYQATNEAYISICCPSSCSPYCCRKAPHTAFLLHDSCVQMLQIASKAPMRALWIAVRCKQPSYANFESVGTIHQIRSVIASLSSATPASLPPAISSTLKQMQTLPRELQGMILNFAAPSLGLSLVMVLLDTLPLIQKKRNLAFYEIQTQLRCVDNIYVSYVTIQGQGYVSKLSKEHCHGTEVLPCTAKPSHIIVSLDELGIRGICFETEGFDPKPLKAP